MLENRAASVLNLEHQEARSASRIKESQDHEKALFLIDYDLGEVDTNGVALVQSLGIAERSILVTGRESDSVILQCANLSLKLIPKSTVDLVRVQVV